jgi:CRISPR-associated endonuclease Cas1
MAASVNLPHSSAFSKSPISKSGVLTIHGYGVQVRMQSGHLEIEDGIGTERRKIRLARVGHGLRRLVCISEDGFTTLCALKWLGDIGASFVMLNRTGKVLFVTGPTAPSDARLRRAQALASGTSVGLEISRKMIDAKVDAQERLARGGLNDLTTAQEIAALRDRLIEADNLATIRILEAHAAAAYFAAWRNIPILWPRVDSRRIPDHWRSVGSRRSPLSGGPRLAVTPVHAILNYCFALLESETRLALVALGLDPALGLGLHSDTPNRDSLVFDVLEPIRPEIEAWVLSWIRREPLRKSDFFETSNGNCRLMSPLCAKLSETAPVWGKLVAPWAEYVARTLWATTSASKGERKLSTPLTQQHRRIAKGRPSFAKTKNPKPERLCRGCGRTVQGDSTNCKKCDVEIATKRLVEVAKAGRVAGHTPEAIAKEAETHRRHHQERSEWNLAKQPAWLTQQVFSEKIQPALANVSATAIAKRIGVSRWYAGRIREGYRPHPRHWQALAELVGIIHQGVDSIQRMDD